MTFETTSDSTPMGDDSDIEIGRFKAAAVLTAGGGSAFIDSIVIKWQGAGFDTGEVATVKIWYDTVSYAAARNKVSLFGADTNPPPDRTDTITRNLSLPNATNTFYFVILATLSGADPADTILNGNAGVSTFSVHYRDVVGGTISNTDTGRCTGLIQARTPLHGGPTYRVADTGSDNLAYGNGSDTYPFRTITKAANTVISGDTISVAAGTFAETVVIATNNLTLTGVDSRVTVINPPGARTTSGLVGIKIQNCTNVLVKNIGVVDANDGIQLIDADSCTITSDSFSGLGNIGVYAKSGAEYSVITSNILNNFDSVGYAVRLDSAQNTVSANTIDSAGSGIRVGSARNVVRQNIIRSCVRFGVDLNGADTNVVVLNEISGCDTGVRVTGSSRGNVIVKNNILNSAAKNVSNPSGLAADFLRNWWGSADSVTIGAKISDTSSAWSPWRQGPVDTSPGADTTAPKAPDTVAVVDTSCGDATVEWSAVSALEESNGGAVGLSGYRIYRSRVRDTSSWTRTGQVGSGVIRFVDTTTSGLGYHYRVTSLDAAAFENESFFSDSQPLDTAPAHNGPNWYVNDTYTAADSYTYAGGSDTNGIGSAVCPFRSLAKVMQKVKSGDTIWLDAGTYGGDTWEIFSATETAAVNLDTDNLTLIGKDSGSTVINPPQDSAYGSLASNVIYGIYADSQVNLTIRNIGVIDAYYGIYFSNVDRSTITNDSVTHCAGAGISIHNNSDTNTLSNNIANWNRFGIWLITGDFYDNTFTGNVTNHNEQPGISLYSCTNATVSNNTANYNGMYGIEMASQCESSTITGNTTDQNVQYGIVLTNSTRKITITNNMARKNLYGIVLNGGSSLNMIAYNKIESNTAAAIVVVGETNTIFSNDLTGGDSGIYITAGTFTANSITKNNIIGNAISSIYNTTSSTVFLTRNWFGSADSVTIKAKLNGVSAFQPWRLGPVDTAAGADSTAPKSLDTAVDTLTVTPSDTSLIVRWSAVTANEDGYGGAAGVQSYAIYRSAVKDTSSWPSVAISTGTQFQDTDVVPGRVYYYRITAYDTATPFKNESFYSDSQPSGSAPFTSRTAWYVNDTVTAGDSYTYAAGHDTTGDGTAANPFLTIGKALSLADTGDAVYVDSGFYYETVAIQTSNLTLAGADSASTRILAPGDSTTSTRYTVYADTGRTGVMIRDLRVSNGYYGVYLANADTATLHRVLLTDNHKAALYAVGADNAAVDSCEIRRTTNSSAAQMYNGTGSIFSRNWIHDNTGFHGLYFENSPRTTVRHNRFEKNFKNHLSLFVNCDTTLIYNNVADTTTNNNGMTTDSSSNVLFDSNTVRYANNIGIGVWYSDSVTVRNNRVTGVKWHGIYFERSRTGWLDSNTLDFNFKNHISIYDRCETVHVRYNTGDSTTNNNGMSADTGLNVVFRSNTMRNSNWNGLGIWNSDSLIIADNTFDTSRYGTYLENTKRTGYADNRVTNSRVYGLWLDFGSNANTIARNLLRNNPSGHVLIGKSDSNIVVMNDLGAGDTGFWVSGSARNNVFQKNNLSNIAVALMYNEAGFAQNLSRNWWGTTQESLITSKFFDTASVFKPYRLGAVDTTAGADTRAPYLFDTSVVVLAGNETALITWDTPTQDEDSEPLSAIAGYSIYRLTVPDTTDWSNAKVADVNAGLNSHVDTGLTNGVKYYYRLTARDGVTFINRSFFTDTKSATPAWFDTGASIVYVASTGDSSDPDANDTSKAFRNINEALSALTPANGWDTIVVFARAGGDSYSVDTIDLASDTGVTLISKKRFSGSDPIFDTWAKLTRDTGTVIKAWRSAIIDGFFIEGVDSTRTSVAGLVANVVEHNGIFMPNSCSGAIVRNVDIRNVYFGVVGDSAHYSQIRNNHISDVVRDGIHFDNGSQNNLIAENTIERQNHPTGHGHGIKLKTNTARNVVRDNVVRNTNMATEFVSTGGQNHIYHNQIYNSDTAVWLSGAGADSFVKNSVAAMNQGATLLDMGSSTAFDARRNWWGRRDMAEILDKMISDGSVKIFPHLTTPPDTSSVAADTTAPGKPDTFALNGASIAGGQVTVTWDTPDFDEDGAAPTAFGEYRIYRLTTSADTTDWKNAFLASVPSGRTSYTDMAVTDGITYRYRLSASETLAGGFFNESVFTDTLSVVPSLDTALPNVWYVNDTSTTGDSFTTAAGSDTHTGLQRHLPLRNLTRLVVLLSAGDTILVDRGIFDSYVPVSSAETAGLKIDTDSVSVIGADSAATVIDPPGAGTVAGLYGIYADTQKGLYVASLAVRGANRGVYFVNVDQSTLTGDSFSANGDRGVYFANGSDTNTVTNGLITSNTQQGIEIAAGSGNTVSGNTIRVNGSDGVKLSNGSRANTVTGNSLRNHTGPHGIHLLNADSNVVTGNTSTNNSTGIYLDQSHFNTLTNNIADTNVNGIFLINGCTNNTISGNSANANTSVGGFIVSGYSFNNTFTNNTANSNTQYGFDIETLDSSTLSNNTAKNNGAAGIYLLSCTDLVVSGNVVTGGLQSGIHLLSTTTRALLRNNLVKSNAQAGILFEDAFQCTATQNDITGNDTGVQFTSASSGNFVGKNNITGNTVSSVHNAAGIPATLTRNWWGTTDEVAIKAKFTDTASAFSPYRLGVVDTAPGADTTAPAAVANVALDTSSGVAIVLAWTIPTVNEETNGGAVAFNGVRIYRTKNVPDTSNWANASLLVKTTGPSDASWTDTNVTIGDTYFYRLSSFDTHSRENASFFTDTKFAFLAVPYWGGPVWYVDKDTGADTFTGHPNYPFKTITRAVQSIPADTQQVDTVLIDRNTYTETVVIDTDHIWIEGVDSGSAGTVLNRGDSSGATNSQGIYASGRTNLVLRNIRVENSYNGINWNAVTNSKIEQVTSQFHAGCAVYLASGSDTNTIARNIVRNSGYGIYLYNNAQGNALTANTARSNGNQGIRLESGSSNNAIETNTIDSNVGSGLFLFSSVNGNTIYDNTVSGADTGIHLKTASSNRIARNTVTAAQTYGVHVENMSSSNTFTGNTLKSNGWSGMNLTASSDLNTVSDNVFMSNGNEGMTMWGANNNTVVRNLFDGHVSSAGIKLTNADSNTFIQNESRSNLYGLRIDQTGGDASHNNRFIRNNIMKSDSYGLFLGLGQSDTPFFWRNFMDTTNEGLPTDNIVTAKTLFGLVFDALDSVGRAVAADTQPRFAMIDTSAAGDSLAPYETAGALTAPSVSNGSAKIRWVTPAANEAGEASPGHTGFRIYRTTNPNERDWKGNTFLATAASSDTEYVDNAVTNGVTYFYRLAAFDAAPFVNESYFTDSVQAVPGGVFVDLGRMTVYVSDQGNTATLPGQPTLDSPAAAFLTLDSALTALDPANGYDTIILFRSKFSAGDSYNLSIPAYDLDTGITIISRKAHAGADNGGGGDTIARIGVAGEGVALRVWKESRLEGLEIDGKLGMFFGPTALQVRGDNVILRAVELKNACTGVELVSGVTGLTIDNCTAVSLGVGFLISGSNALIRKSTITFNNRYGIYADGGGNGRFSDNVITNNAHGVYLNSSGNILVRNKIANNTAFGVEFLSTSTSIHANDITGNDTGVKSPMTGPNTIQWNNIFNNTGKNIHQTMASTTIAYNYFGTTDMNTIFSKLTVSGNYTPFRFASIDTRPGADSIAPNAPAGVTADASMPGRITVRWSPPSANEDGTSVGTIGGYRVFRLSGAKDTTNWRGLTPVSDTTLNDTYLIDTIILPGSVNYYRVLAFDADTHEGWLADTQSASPIFSGSGAVRFVTDTGATASYIKVRAGDSVLVEVNDSDPNTNPAVIQSCTVLIVNLTLGTETETVTCTELSADSPIFSGKIMMTTMSSDTPNSGKLLVRPSDQIRVTYVDTPSGGDRTMTATMVASGVGGDSAIIDSGAHQIVASGGAAVFQVTVKDSSGEGVPGAIVNFKVEHEGAEVGNPSGTTTDSGSLTQSIPLTSGDGVYTILVSTRPGDTDDARTVVYTDRRRVPAANKWIMFTPFRRPDTQTTSLVGIAKLASSGALLAYWYDPASGGSGSFGKYKSIAGQASPNNSSNGEFPAFESGRSYWIKSAQASGVGLAGTTYTATSGYSIRLAAGANMIGNPFPHYIDWLDDVYVDTNLNDAPNSIQVRSLTNVLIIDTAIQWRDPNAEQYISPMAAGDTTIQLKPWVGVWVKVNQACTMTFYPTKHLPQTLRVKQMAPLYVQGSDQTNWRLRLMAYGATSEIRDEYTYVGVAPAAQEGEDMNDVWKAPGMMGDLQVLVGAAGENGGSSAKYFGASIAPPVKTATSWPVLVTGPAGNVKLSWDVAGVPQGYAAYLIGGSSGPVDMLKSPSTNVVLNSSAGLTLAVGLPEYLAAFLAAPLSKENSFAYPNPGPDAAGNIVFKYNLQAASDVTLKIFDVGGKLVRELKESGAAGSNTTLKWDGTNKNGQKLGSGVYIYILESGGNKLIDKVAIVR